MINASKYGGEASVSRLGYGTREGAPFKRTGGFMRARMAGWLGKR